MPVAPLLRFSSVTLWLFVNVPLILRLPVETSVFVILKSLIFEMFVFAATSTFTPLFVILTLLFVEPFAAVICPSIFTFPDALELVILRVEFELLFKTAPCRSSNEPPFEFVRLIVPELLLVMLVPASTTRFPVPVWRKETTAPSFVRSELIVKSFAVPSSKAVSYTHLTLPTNSRV